MNDKTPREIVEHAELTSNCCGATPSNLSDSLCGQCLEHADFE